MLPLAFTILGLVLMATSLPLIAGKVPPNRFYGFRTPRTVKDERVWYPVNRMAGRNVLVLSLAFFAMAAAAAFGLVGIWAWAALGALGLFGLIATFVSASRIVSEVDRGGPLIDYSSRFDRAKKADSAKERAKLMEKLRRE